MNSPSTSGRPIGARWLPWLVALAGLAAPSGLQAQTAKVQGGSASQPSASDARALSRYFPKENLLFYFEFTGLDAHAATWNKTAAYRLLTETPMGVMLEAVSGQLLDKVFSYIPGNKVSGPEFVTLAEHVTRSGWAAGLHVIPKAGDSAAPPQIHGTLVFRGVSSKEMRSISARSVSWLMGFTDAKPRIERKAERTMVVVPHAMAGLPAGHDASWAWWAEKDDLVISSGFPSGADVVLSALDGKVPSATDHPIVKELSKPEADFDAVCLAFVDIANCPKTSDKMTEFISKVAEAGIQRIDYRWGFDDDALMSITRIIAPKPRKPLLALFDQPGFAKMAVLPMPDGVDTFLELSISPNQILDTIGELDPSGGLKGKIDEFAETVERTGKVDLRKELLAHIGPRIVLYVAPGRSAAATNESFESGWLQGFNLGPMNTGSPAKALAKLATLPKVTLVAEVDDPVKFGRALDGAIIAMNSELKAQALEATAEEPAEPANQGGANAGRGPGGRQGAGAPGKRAPRRRSADATPAPKFESMPGMPEGVTAYLLRTPPDSALRLGPPGFRPVIRLEGKYVAISIVADAAETALKAVKRKDWKPSDDVQRACQRLPANMVVLALIDPREILPPVLSSFPATLQTLINSVIVVRAQMAANGGIQPGGPQGMGSGAPPAMGPGGRSGGRRMSGAPGMPGAPGGASGPPGGAPAAGGTNPPGSAEGTIVLKVDADKLPQAEAIRSRLFLTTVSVVVSDQDIRLVTRKAFPNLFNWSIYGLVISQAAAAQMQLHAQQIAAAQAAQPNAPAPAPGPGAGGPPGSRRGGPGGAGPGGAMPKPGGRRGRGGN